MAERTPKRAGIAFLFFFSSRTSTEDVWGSLFGKGWTRAGFVNEAELIQCRCWF